MKYPFIFISLLLFASACGNGGSEENEESTSQTQGTPVHVEELHLSDFQHFVNVQGDIESDKTIMITPKVTATVEEILVRAGDDVQQGDVLANLDGEVTRSQLRELETQLELAETLFERQQNLRDQDIGSEVEFLQSRNQVESLQNQLVTLTEQFENYTILATISGTVNQVNLKVGETVGPEAPVFQLSNSDALKATAEISEAYITKIDQTDSVEISFPSLDEIISKRLDVVSKVINQSNRTFGIEVYIPNESDQIRPNMIAKLKINDVTLTDQIVVPVNTVREADNISFTFVAEETDDGWIATRKEVTTGQSYGNELVIEDGLNPGDLLITAGYADLSDGEAISIQEN
ncbi:MAG: efflux RND transporter periplasmic adaptor subunit [Balneolaceae bacterium]